MCLSLGMESFREMEWALEKLSPARTGAADLAEGFRKMLPPAGFARTDAN